MKNCKEKDLRNDTTDKMENNKVIASHPKPVSDPIEDDGTPLEESDACKVESNQRATKRKLDDDEDEKDVKKSRTIAQLKQLAAKNETESNKSTGSSDSNQEDSNSSTESSDAEDGIPEWEKEKYSDVFKEWKEFDEEYEKWKQLEVETSCSDSSESIRNSEIDADTMMIGKVVTKYIDTRLRLSVLKPLRCQVMWSFFDEKIQELPMRDIDDFKQKTMTLLFDKIKAYYNRRW